MKRVLLALAAVAILAGGLLTDTADAQRRHRGGAVAAGVIGGLAAGAIIGSQIQPRYRPAPGYVTYDGYYARGPIECRGGYWARRPVTDRWGNVIGYSKPRYFCP